MSNLIQIKRSLTTALPTSLANGELAFTSNGDVLYIGANGGIVPIAGKRVPGTLTANQAIVANSSGYVDYLKTANAWIDTVYANGSVGTPGQVLVSNGSTVYWGTGTSGSNTQVQFNDSGVANATAGFTFNKTTNTLFVGNTIQVNNFEVNSVTTGTSIVVGNSTVNTVINAGNVQIGSMYANGTYISVPGNIDAYTANLTTSFNVGADVNVNTSMISVGNSTSNVEITATGITSSGGTGVNPYSNSTGTTLGTASSRWVVSANTVDASGLITAASGVNVTGAANVSSAVNIGANVTVNTGAISIGNSTVNSTHTSSLVTVSNSTSTANLVATGLVVGNTVVNGSTIETGNSTANVVITTTGITTSGGTGVNPYANLVGATLGTSSARWVIAANSINATGLIEANGGIDVNGTANVSSNILVGSNVVVNTSAYFVGNSTANAVLNKTALTVTDGSSTANITSTGLKVGTTTVNNSTITVDDLVVNGNSQLGSNTSDIVSINGLVNTNIIPSTNNAYLLGNNSSVWQEIHTSNVHAVDGYFTGDVDIQGNLVVTGNVITTNVQSVIISDPLIYLAGNNYSSDLVDIGFVGNYHQAGVDKHTGVFRHAATDQYYIFKGLTQELDTVSTINIADPSFALADVNAYLLSGGLVSNATAVAITANSTVTVNVAANTLTLSVALGETSGGTGQNTYTSGDILVGNTGNTLSKLSLGTLGYVLQSNGTALVYDTLDGGTF